MRKGYLGLSLAIGNCKFSLMTDPDQWGMGSVDPSSLIEGHIVISNNPGAVWTCIVHINAELSFPMTLSFPPGSL
jgi:hypothetical protein